MPLGRNHRVVTATARRSPSGTPLTFPIRTTAMTTTYRVSYLLGDREVLSSLIEAPSEEAAIDRAKQEKVTIRSDIPVTYVAFPIVFDA